MEILKSLESFKFYLGMEAEDTEITAKKETQKTATYGIGAYGNEDWQYEIAITYGNAENFLSVKTFGNGEAAVIGRGIFEEVKNISLMIALKESHNAHFIVIPRKKSGRSVIPDNGVAFSINPETDNQHKLMKALGYYKVDVPTGEVYKTGLKKGQPKTRKEWRTDGVGHVLEWAIQLNYYRILLEQAGFKVKNMVVQALCRDYSLRMASERNITRPLYLIKINRISDHWIKLYMSEKAKRLQKAVKENHLPARCSARERWHDQKCQSYCDVAEFCPYGRLMKRSADRAA